jgi:hypothetical protein
VVVEEEELLVQAVVAQLVVPVALVVQDTQLQ